MRRPHARSCNKRNVKTTAKPRRYSTYSLRPKLAHSKKDSANRNDSETHHTTPLSISNAWQATLTLKDNYAQVGLVSDCNKDLRSVTVNKSLNKMQDEYTNYIANDEFAPSPELTLTASCSLFLPASAPKDKVSVPEFIPFLQERNEPSKIFRPLSPRELSSIKQLIDTFGNDYQRMSRDTKINSLQWTESDCRHKISKYYLQVTS